MNGQVYSSFRQKCFSQRKWILLIQNQHLPMKRSWIKSELMVSASFNTFKPRQDCRHFADNIFKYILLDENEWFSLKLTLNVVPKFGINSIPALVQIMFGAEPGDG